MSAPGWSRWILVGLLLGVATYHLLRLLSGRWRRNSGKIYQELTHLITAAAMTAMLVGALAPAGDRLLTIMFGASAVWFAASSIHSYIVYGPATLGARAQLVAGCTAMTYMLTALEHRNPMASMGAHSIPSAPLTVLFVGAIAAVTVVSLRDLRACPTGLGARPALAAGCQLAMNATTVFMLVSM